MAQTTLCLRGLLLPQHRWKTMLPQDIPVAYTGISHVTFVLVLVLLICTKRIVVYCIYLRIIVNCCIVQVFIPYSCI